MARWSSSSGAIGYRLDVSTSPTFDRFVDGYRDLDVGNSSGRAVTGLERGTTYYYRVRPYGVSGMGSSYSAMTATTAAGSGLVINAVFDSSITSNPNALAMEGAINRAIAIYESLFSDPVSISILFRYSATGPDGGPLSSSVSQSDFVVYTIPWATYINALRADSTTSYDVTANNSLPTAPISSNIRPSGANGRAIGLNTPPAMSSNGSVGSGPYDGIVTVNSTVPFQFTRPASSGNYDAQRSIEHEIDEVIGLGSHIGQGADLRPQDLFSWVAPSTRNVTASGTRYFSINSGSTDLVNFNQDPGGDFGDWLSGACPQVTPYVQNAFGCTGQVSDVTATSPEGINLDVIGYDLASARRTASTDVNGDGNPDYVLTNGSTLQTAVWYLNNNVRIGAVYGPNLPSGWNLVDLGDFDRDGHADYVLFNPTTEQTAIWYLSGATFRSGAYGPTLPAGWQLVAVGDFNGDGKPDYVLYNPSTRQTALWYLSNNVRVGGTYGLTLPAGWSLAGVADFNLDGHLDYVLFNSANHQSVIWYLSGAAFAGSSVGPTIASGYVLNGVADFNGDGKQDYVLSNPSTGQTAIWYLNNNVFVSALYGPTLPAGWSLAAP